MELNKKLAEEAHANEMRHMIGNVAHDLKTVSVLLGTHYSERCDDNFFSNLQPLSALVSGADLIMSVLQDSPLVALAGAAECAALSSIRDSTANMKNIHQFMLMTINRCIDYTKVSGCCYNRTV